ncbi:MAG: NmrA/HSCARG family protein [Solirubrobacterales bacterium]
MAERLVLVGGATGRQGRAVTEALRAKGHAVRALVRSTDDPATEPLRELGVELVVGDNDNRESLEAAAAGVDSMFAMTTPAVGVDVEVEHGRALVNAAAAAGVEHIVYSSVASADGRTGIPHFDSKQEVEEYLTTQDIPSTVVAPVWFMDNLLFPWTVADLRNGSFRLALAPDTKLQQVFSQDIGAFAAHALDQREPFLGERVEIAGDELTGAEMARVLADATGRPISFEEQSLDEVRSQFEDMATMYEWIGSVGFSADPGRLHAEHAGIDWTSFEQWASDQDWDEILSADPEAGA